MTTICPNCAYGHHGQCDEQGCDCDCQLQAVVASLDDDYVNCGWCGEPFNDGGGLYCCSECEEMANSSGE